MNTQPVAGDRARLLSTRSLGLRLAARGLVSALVLGCLLAILVVWALYQRSLDELQHRFQTLESAHLPGLVDALWSADPQRIQRALESLSQTPDIAAIELLDADAPHWRWRTNEAFNPVNQRTFMLVHVEGSRSFPVGELKVELGDHRIKARLRRDSLLAVLVLVGSQLALAVVFLRLFSVEVGRPLRSMAAYARSLRAESLERPLQLQRKQRAGDELDEVVLAVNAMREGLRDELFQRHRLQKALDAHLQELEARVQERTAALGAEAARSQAALRELERTQAALEAMARVDALTSLPNRRALTEALDAECLRSSRSGRSFAVILADVDHFKSINDRFGHQAGDHVLVEVAARLRSGVRAQDPLARWGGEEFLLLLPETGAEGAGLVAEKVRRLIADTPIEIDGVSIRVSLTQGVAERMPDESPLQLLKRADVALYRGKQAGRDRVVLV